MSTVKTRLRQGETDRLAIGELLQEMDLAARLAAMRTLKGREQARLFELMEGTEPLTPAQLLPPDARPGTTWIWEGVNSLPLFRRFQKRFCTVGAEEGELSGYNHQSMKWLVGPGCFIARPSDDGAPGALVFDYERTPSAQPEGWPRVRPATAGLLSRLVYGHMHDYMRKVSEDVMVGWAWKKGKPTSNYFILTRGAQA